LNKYDYQIFDEFRKQLEQLNIASSDELKEKIRIRILLYEILNMEIHGSASYTVALPLLIEVGVKFLLEKGRQDDAVKILKLLVSHPKTQDGRAGIIAQARNFATAEQVEQISEARWNSGARIRVRGD
jgi:hypothetical protein